MPLMNNTEFNAWAIESIKRYLPENWKNAEIDIHQVNKTGSIYLSMTVRQKGQMTAPAINLEAEYEVYRSGVPLDAVGLHMATIVQMKAPDIDTHMFDSYEAIKENLFIRVCGQRENKELLESVPHKKIEDLAITYHIMVDVSNEGMSSAMVTNDILESFHIDPEKLHEDAMKQSQYLLPPRIDSMMNIMSGLTDIEMESIGIHDNPSMVVITNQAGLNGASALFYPGTMKEVADRLGGDYFVLPSSIHEVIAIPTSLGSNYRDLEKMVREINDNVVDKEDQLTNSVYRYDAKTQVFELASGHATRERIERHRAREMER